ncbi:MAG: hypothetical protein Q7J09_10300 [Methanocalculus sp.]|uniref:hypothetical protein n=1 Tax=Methanocalculus sp. TaxID=2004547 RepID=UPI002717B229|nr:hypothetical protein [Methanocalculus sp.]MDO9540375.1 hypothetical protein [Methanocalculus sp.]
MAEKREPCCAADAMRRIRQIDVGGIVVGLAMLDDAITEVAEMKLAKDEEITDELMKRIKIFNYIPQSAEQQYRSALLKEYTHEVRS